jgi:hypothetical protein
MRHARFGRESRLNLKENSNVISHPLPGDRSLPVAAQGDERLDAQLLGAADPRPVSRAGRFLRAGRHPREERAVPREDGTEQKGEIRYRECQYGSFSRSVTLPGAVDNDKVQAAYKDGVLEITLPKAKGAEGKEIKVEQAK